MENEIIQPAAVPKTSWAKATYFAFKELFTRSPKLGEVLKKTVIIILLVVPLLGLSTTVMTRIEDYSPPFPSLESTQETKGVLDQVRLSRRYYWKLTALNGEEVFLQPEGYFWQPQKEKAPPQVRVRWFRLPSGVGHVAELEIEGKLVGSYEQMRLSYEGALQGAYTFRRHLIAALLIGGLIMLRRILVFRNSNFSNTGVNEHVA